MEAAIRSRAVPCAGYASQLAAVRAMLGEGLGSAEIRRRTGMSAATLSKLASRVRAAGEAGPPAPDTWSPERVKLLTQLWLDGLSATQVAATMGEGVTRNAVIGKVSRLKLKRGDRKARRRPAENSDGFVAAQRKSRIAARQRVALAGAFPPPAVLSSPLPRGAETDRAGVIGATTGAAMVALGADQCKWPVGDPLEPGFGFCRLPRQGEKSPYCAAHGARATRADYPTVSPARAASGSRLGREMEAANRREWRR